MKIQIFKLLIILSFSFFLIRYPFLALSASPSPIPQEQVQEKIKERLEQATQNMDQVKQALQEKKKIYGYSGNIKSVLDNSLTLTTIFGDKQANVATNAAIVKMISDKEKTPTKLADIKIGQFALILGYLENNNLLVKRIVITAEPTVTIERKLIYGKITEVDDKKIGYKNDTTQGSVLIDTKSKFKIAGLDKPSIDDIQIGDTLICIVVKDKQDQDYLKTSLIIPGTTNPKSNNNAVNATSSASPQKPTKK